MWTRRGLTEGRQRLPVRGHALLFSKAALSHWGVSVADGLLHRHGPLLLPVQPPGGEPVRPHHGLRPF